MFNEVSKSPQGRRNVLANVIDAVSPHGEEEGGGRGVGWGPSMVSESLMKNRVPLGEVSTMAKECLPRASAALG